MLGRLLNTMRYRLNRDLTEWRKTNTVLHEYAWLWPQRMMIAASQYPIRVSLTLCLVVLVLSAEVWGYHALNSLLSIILSTNPPTPLDNVNQNFFALWTIQAAIAALIYPIVIGFVTLLLQRRHSAKASLEIYLHDSAALLTGLSALSLVFSMGVQFIFIREVGENTVTGWLVIDVSWFLINILGVIWFLVRTFDYLRPARRVDIMRTYAINHIWPDEVRRNLEINLFLGAIHYGWIPGPAYGDKENDSDTAILLNPMGRDMGNIQVTTEPKGKNVISDVRFRLLSMAVRSWENRENILSLSSDETPDAFSKLQHTRLLILPSVPGKLFEPEVGFCRTENSSGLNWWERQLIRRSFSLIPLTDNSSSLSINNLFNDLITEIQIYMQAGEEIVFREAVDELVDLHADLIKVSDFIIDDGKHDNYANLVDRNHLLWPGRVHELWTRQYHRLMEAAIARLSVREVYFQNIVHITGWLISRLKKIRPVSILCNLLKLSGYLHYRLNRWWSKTVEEQGALKHDPCEQYTLNSPAFSVYESAIKEFVGSWESLKNYYFPPARDDERTWAELCNYTDLYVDHLEETLYMLFDSILLGNKEGAEWLCDVLIKWWGTMRFRFDDVHFYIRDEQKLTLELTHKPWEEARNAIDLSMAGGNEDNAPTALWGACVRNYWTDLCCLSLYTINQLGKDCVCEKSLPARLVTALAQGRALREGGSEIDVEWPLRTIENLLITVIRQYYFDGGYFKGYRARLDKVVERISAQGRPSMVQSRIYSGWGLSNLESLKDGQLFLLCLFVKKGWLPSARLIESIQKWGIKDDDNFRALVDMMKQWKTRLNETDFHEYQSYYSCVQQTSDDFKDTIEWLAKGLDYLISALEGFRFEQLRDAQVSEMRLSEVARWSSRSGFIKDTAKVPVSLFHEVRHLDEEYSEHSLTLKEMNKGEFVEPEMAQRVSNENEWFDHTIRNYVAAAVMGSVLKTLNPEVLIVDSPTLYWEQIKISAANIRKENGMPVLFVAGRADPRWLRDWTRTTYDDRVFRPEGLQFIRDKQYDIEGYIGRLNDIPVFIAPIRTGSSYLIPMEALNGLSFTEFEDGVFVKVSWESIDEKKALINLNLSWCLQLDLNMRECYQLQYIPKKETKEDR